MRRLPGLYGDSPLHLLALLASIALAGYAVLQARTGALPLRMAIWFLLAAVAHDLVLFPLYALADRSLQALHSRAPRRGRTASPGAVNYVRVPLLLSAMLLLMFYPLVLHRSEDTYGRATGLDQRAYLGHWLLVSAALFGASAVLLAVRAARHRSKADAS